MTNEVTIIQGIETRELFTSTTLNYAIDKIEADIKSIHVDASTEKGRGDIISLSVKVRDSKTLVEKVRKQLGEDLRIELNTINDIGKKAVDRLQKLQDETRLPVTEFENKEKERVAGHENALLLIKNITDGVIALDNNELEHIQVQSYKDMNFEEFKQRADIAIIALEKAISDRLAVIEKDAELARLQKAEQERIQKEREELIAKEAAEKATKEADERAAKEKAEMERKAQAERDEALRKQKEADESLKRAEQEKIKAVEAERAKIESEKQAELEATKKREADKAHRSNINNEALSGLVTLGLTQEQAKAVVTAIAKGEIAHVSIKY